MNRLVEVLASLAVGTTASAIAHDDTGDSKNRQYSEHNRAPNKLGAHNIN